MARNRIELLPCSSATEALDLGPGISRVAVGTIFLRDGGDQRGLNAAHVVMLVESIGVLGLLEPIVVDTTGHLLAGGHRLAAVQLLAIPGADERREIFLKRSGHDSKGERKPSPELTALADRVAAELGSKPFQTHFPKKMVPVTVIDLSGKDAKRLPLAIEAAENTVRRQYTADDIKALAARFKAAGCSDSSGGRPKEGEKTVMWALETALGRSKRHIQRILRPGKPAPIKIEWIKATDAFRRAAERMVTVRVGLNGIEDGELLQLANQVIALHKPSEDSPKR